MDLRQEPPATPAGEIIVELRTSSFNGPSSGTRILTDGRYETFGGPAAETYDWWALTEPLNEEQLAAVVELMDSLDLAALDPSYEPEEMAADSPSTTWMLRVDGQIKVVKVRGRAVVPALVTLEAAFPEQEIASSAVLEWTMAFDGPPKTYVTDAGMPLLDHIDIKLGGHDSTKVEGEPSAGATMVLRRAWKTGDEENERQELYSDGFLIYWVGSEVYERRQFNPTDLAWLKQHVQAIDWSRIPQVTP